MTRQKIEIKKIDNIAARQVTFSKRRRGLFKKAHELATLCDADIALIVFSASGKLFDYSTSSTQELLRRQNMVPENNNFTQPVAVASSQLGNSVHAELAEEFATKTNELRHMRGEELQGLGIEELKQLEKLLEIGLSRVVETKDEKFLKEIGAIKEKEALLMKENQRLRNQMANLNGEQEQAVIGGHNNSLGSNTSNSSSSANPNSQHYDSSDISLELGL
ncbi:MADS-box protein JOINTLESS-like [Momordica charantia]|uniref:MADS-box protein JOINTLESS-like n=1 Tax=Momordica charantia TaxID=3673 RepID=A0A6J1D7D5_MOMCH|nr:MADS-box protein JOINTLESS-like [Momordica charantia]